MLLLQAARIPFTKDMSIYTTGTASHEYNS